MGIRFVRVVAILLVLVLAWPSTALVKAVDSEVEEPLPDLLVSELQTASSDKAGEDFVEVYNNDENVVDFDILTVGLEYKSATGQAWYKRAALSGQLDAGAYYILAAEDYLPELSDDELAAGIAKNGHIRLAMYAGQDKIETLDFVSWGDAAEPEEGSAASAPKAGSSIQRCLKDDHMIDTDDNSADLAVYDETTPADALDCETQTPDEEDEEPDDETFPPTGLTCEGIMISEVLPNAAGSDTGNEFIELYNPTTDFIELSGCGIQLGDKTYQFDDIMLNPEEYKAFSDAETGLTLPNASGGTLYLLSADEAELQELAYPGSLDDDVAWAWFGAGTWEQTYTPTPRAANVAQPLKPCPVAGQVRSPETGRCNATQTGGNGGLKPCAPDQFRNPATNRCKKKSSAENSLKPCAPDQFRNPETNRCKKKTSDEDELKPCNPDQYRNPETNRCKKKDSAASQLKPCKPNQERNPETNRCRKKAGATLGSDTDVKDIQAAQSSSSSWWIAGVAATGAAGYGLWEWRRDLTRAASRLGRKLAGSSSQ